MYAYIFKLYVFVYVHVFENILNQNNMFVVVSDIVV